MWIFAGSYEELVEICSFFTEYDGLPLRPFLLSSRTSALSGSTRALPRGMLKGRLFTHVLVDVWRRIRTDRAQKEPYHITF